MRRLIIFGGTASGKTTVTKILSNKLDIPCYSTDGLCRNPIENPL